MAVWSSSYATIPLRYGGFRYGLTLGIGTPKIIASTGVLVRVVCALIARLANFLAHKARFDLLKHIGKATATKRWAQREILRGEATRETNRTPTENSGIFDELKYLDDRIGIKCA
jgi:hypothetical protein